VRVQGSKYVCFVLLSNTNLANSKAGTRELKEL
jgi:hypothetical protein